MGKKIIIISVFAMLLSLLPYYVLSTDKNQPFQYAKNPQIQQIKPKKPVRVKLHRTAKGEYSWDLTGDDVDEVYRSDKRLRKLLNVE
jgi:hypothetical protein